MSITLLYPCESIQPRAVRGIYTPKVNLREGEHTLMEQSRAKASSHSEDTAVTEADRTGAASQVGQGVILGR